jgi:RsiW-degrading membrane proteinase PrsW (M82 family)/ribosomal protein S18 acetylase RimI-like enzyme
VRVTDLSAQPPPPIARAPRKWIGRKGGLLIVALGAVLWIGNLLFVVIVFHADEAPTGSLLIGAFTVASAFIYTMAYRLRPSDGLSVTRLLLAFLVGGILAVTLAAPVDALDNLWSGGTTRNDSLVGLSLAGVVEELVKIFIVVLVSKGLARKNVRNGLFLGGAVGFGFAAFENISYARDAWNDAVAAHAAALPQELYVVISRDVIGIFGHPLFTALLAAALFAGVRRGRFRITWRIVLVYLGVALAHGLFDAIHTLVYLLTGSNELGETAFYAVVVIEAVVLSLIWRRVSLRANYEAGLAVVPASASDLSFLTSMLVDAVNWDGTRATTSASVHEDPLSWRYLDGWQRATDFGVVALDGDQPVGAAWARFLTAHDNGYGYVNDAIPELTLAVVATARHRGVGRQLLDALIEAARDRSVAGLSLSVEDGNRSARALYARGGFQHVGRSGNSDTMLLKLQE